MAPQKIIRGQMSNTLIVKMCVIMYIKISHTGKILEKKISTIIFFIHYHKFYDLILLSPWKWSCSFPSLLCFIPPPFLLMLNCPHSVPLKDLCMCPCISSLVLWIHCTWPSVATMLFWIQNGIRLPTCEWGAVWVCSPLSHLFGWRMGCSLFVSCPFFFLLETGDPFKQLFTKQVLPANQSQKWEISYQGNRYCCLELLLFQCYQRCWP